jgi:hypothetical protein
MSSRNPDHCGEQRISTKGGGGPVVVSRGTKACHDVKEGDDDHDGAGTAAEVGPREVFHPRWCSPDHCQVRGVGDTEKSHESARVEIGGLTLSVNQAAIECQTHPVLIIEEDPTDEESSAVVLRLYEAPGFAKALLEFFCQLP